MVGVGVALLSGYSDSYQQAKAEVCFAIHTHTHTRNRTSGFADFHDDLPPWIIKRNGCRRACNFLSGRLNICVKRTRAYKIGAKRFEISTQKHIHKPRILHSSRRAEIIWKIEGKYRRQKVYLTKYLIKHTHCCLF